MNEFDFNDKRTSKDFKTITFSQFKKTDVKKQYLKCLLDGRIEPSNYWCAELICSGHYLDIWEIILLVMSKHIHIGNPKLPIYIELRFSGFKEIVRNGYLENELSMRNNIKIRNLFCEINCIICFSQKKHTYDIIKISKTDFNITELNYKLHAKKLDYALDSYMQNDPKELFIACNELAYNVSIDCNNSTNACYWIEWILEYEILCKKKKEKCLCERRQNIPVDSKLQMDIVWIIWDILINASNHKSSLIKKIINSLLLLFCIKFKPGVKKKRRFILYYVVSLLTEKIDEGIQLYKNKTLLYEIQNKIHYIYKEIKKNQIAPETDYLYKGLEKSNLEKTIEKIEKMSSITYVPRK